MQEVKTNYRGRITIDFIDTPRSARPEVIVSTDGEVFPLDAVMAFGQVLDSSINHARDRNELGLPNSQTHAWQYASIDMNSNRMNSRV